MTDDAHDFLMSTGAPTAKFPTIGTKIEGVVIRYEKSQQTDLKGNLKFFESGSEMWQIVFTLQTEENDKEIDNDDGIRKLYAKGNMLGAIRDAVKKAGYRGRLEGGVLGVVYSGDGEQARQGYTAPKEYVAKFEPPVPDLEDGTEPF